MKRTGPTNPRLITLIEGLKRSASEGKVNLFQRLAYDLESSTRSRRIVNLSNINRFTKAGETIVVPGKVLGSGNLDHALTIYAFDYSQGALESIRQAKATALSIEELLKSGVKDKRIRVIG